MSDGQRAGPAGEVGGRYAHYVLGVLILVYVFNFIDRNILSILAEDIKADLGISDAQMGFLYGTVFAVFYSVFGIPLARFADVGTRRTLVAVGLSFWSLMTAASGSRAPSVSSQRAASVSVSVRRARARRVLDAGGLLPATTARDRHCSLRGRRLYRRGHRHLPRRTHPRRWAALSRSGRPRRSVSSGGRSRLLSSGLPGLAMSLWVATLREPRRGQSEGMTVPVEPPPFRVAGRELLAVLPPLTLIAAARIGRRALIANVAAAALVTVLVSALIALIGNPTQWIALGIGVYAALSWAQNLASQDPATFSMIFRCKTLRCIGLGFPFIAFVTYGVGFWAPPFMLRVHGVDASTTGTILGLSAAVGGFLGVTSGGWISDRLRARSVNARLWVGIAAPLLTLPVGIMFLTTDNLIVAYACNFIFSIVSPMWLGPGAGTLNDLVMPRMRAMASAFYILMITFIGLALGPFTIGQLSDWFVAGGMSSAEALRLAMLWGLSSLVVTFVLLLLALRYLDADERSRLDRARAAGEPV